MTAAIVVGVVFGALAGYLFALWRREARHCEQWCGEATRMARALEFLIVATRPHLRAEDRAVVDRVLSRAINAPFGQATLEHEDENRDENNSNRN